MVSFGFLIGSRGDALLESSSPRLYESDFSLVLLVYVKILVGEAIVWYAVIFFTFELLEGRVALAVIGFTRRPDGDFMCIP